MSFRKGLLLSCSMVAPYAQLRMYHTYTVTDESRGPRGDFILAETLVQNGTAGNNGTAGGILNQPVLGLLVGDETPSWRHFVR